MHDDLLNALFFTRLAILLFIRRLLTLCMSPPPFVSYIHRSNTHRDIQGHALDQRGRLFDTAPNPSLHLHSAVPTNPLRLFPSPSRCRLTPPSGSWQHSIPGSCMRTPRMNAILYTIRNRYFLRHSAVRRTRVLHMAGTLPPTTHLQDEAANHRLPQDCCYHSTLSRY